MAKDTHDKKTGDLLKTPNARRQAEFKAKMRAEGKAQKTEWVDFDSFEKGLADGQKAWKSGQTLNDYINKIVTEQHYDVLGYVMGFKKGCTAAKN
jgi:hypothetical protein